MQASVSTAFSRSPKPIIYLEHCKDNKAVMFLIFYIFLFSWPIAASQEQKRNKPWQLLVPPHSV